jgi:predicted PurR-regulated permease PerM
VLLIGGLSMLTFFVVLPFAQFVIAAAILTYVLFPLHRRLKLHVGSGPSALLLIGSSLIVSVLPLVYIMLVFVRNFRAIARGESGLDVMAIEEWVAEITGEEIDLTTGLTVVGQELVDILFGGPSEIVTGSVKASLGLAMMLFLVYYFLLEGPSFVSSGSAISSRSRTG